MLRDCVDMMGVGGVFAHTDTVAEDIQSVDTKGSATLKEMGDVRSALLCCLSLISDLLPLPSPVSPLPPLFSLLSLSLSLSLPLSLCVCVCVYMCVQIFPY
jgi:hypothetical protein